MSISTGTFGTRAREERKGGREGGREGGRPSLSSYLYLDPALAPVNRRGKGYEFVCGKVKCT